MAPRLLSSLCLTTLVMAPIGSALAQEIPVVTAYPNAVHLRKGYGPIDPVDLSNYLGIYPQPGPQAVISFSRNLLQTEEPFDVEVQLYYAVADPQENDGLDEIAPQTVTSFLTLAREGRYADQIVHDVLTGENEIVSAGRWRIPEGHEELSWLVELTGAGNTDPFQFLEWREDYPHKKGVLGARIATVNQEAVWFINATDNSDYIDADFRPQFPAFGEIINESDHEILDALTGKKDWTSVVSLPQENTQGLLEFPQIPLIGYTQEDADAYRPVEEQNLSVVHSIELLEHQTSATLRYDFSVQWKDTFAAGAPFVAGLEDGKLTIEEKEGGEDGAEVVEVVAYLGEKWVVLPVLVDFVDDIANYFSGDSLEYAEDGWVEVDWFGRIYPAVEVHSDPDDPASPRVEKRFVRGGDTRANLDQPSQRHVYHEHHETLYLAGRNTRDGMWYWDYGIGPGGAWVFTNPSYYPYVYIENPTDSVNPFWAYYYAGSAQERWFYSYRQQDGQDAGYVQVGELLEPAQ